MTESNATKELEKARLARKSGYESKSRVLARRAAAFAIREYLRVQVPTMAEFALNDLLKDPSVRELMPITIHTALDRLTTRVNENYQLPVDVDLLADAQSIVNLLKNKSGETQ